MKRGIAHILLQWDEELHDKVAKDRYCYQHWEGCPGPDCHCPDQGYVRHLGKRFTPDPDDYTTFGLPITAPGKVVGLTGGYGWLMEFNRAPKKLELSRMEIDPDGILMLSIKYPPGTTFDIVAWARQCREKNGYVCDEVYEQTNDIEEVKRLGNKYHVDAASGVLT